MGGPNESVQGGDGLLGIVVDQQPASNIGLTFEDAHRLYRNPAEPVKVRRWRYLRVRC